MGLLDEAIREHLELKRRRGADAGEISRAESEALAPVRRAPDGTPDLGSIPVPADSAGPPPVADPPGAEPAAAEPHPVADAPAFDDDEPDWGDETVALTPPPIPAQPPTAVPESPAPGYVMPPEPPPAAFDEDFDDDAPLPPLEDEPPEPSPEKPRRLPGAGRLRLRRGRGEKPARDPFDDADDRDPPPAARERPYEPPPPPAPLRSAPPPAPAPAPQDVAPGENEPAGEDLLEETPEFLEETPDHDRLWFEQRPPRDFDFDK